jgi:chemotaxis protein methyltransferase CheR
MSAVLSSMHAPEPALSSSDFALIREIAYSAAGIVVREHKEAMIRGRLMRRVRELGLASVSEYCSRLRNGGLEQEMGHLLNVLTTNHTAFFREAHHFEHLGAEALAALCPEGVARTERLRIWCAAASSGEEPYTIAAMVYAFAGGVSFRDLKILATDIDTEVLAKGEAGVYPRAALEALPPAQQQALVHTAHDSDRVRMSDRLRQMIAFRRLNIIEPWPMAGPFDIIFCRNMLIYFDPPTKQDIVARMSALLRPGGYLYLGHAEALTQGMQNLIPCGRTIYRRGA